jgi:UrcA family protein
MTYTVSLAALALTATLAITSAATAAVTVKVSDLNTANPAQAQALKARVDTAAQRYCRDNASPTADATGAACRQAVRDEIYAKLAARQTVQVATR